MAKDIILPRGTVLNGYTILKKLGKGGFGITYLVKDDRGNQLVLKELFISSEGICQRGYHNEVIISSSDKELFDFAKNRFVDEARILQTLDHRAIVKVYQHFFANNTAYYAMEYLPGTSLQEYITNNGALNEEDAMRRIFPIFEAIKEMHKKGLWHRDIKPDNMMISGDRTVLIDFGAVKVTDDKIFSVNREKSLFAAMTKTYAAPEQIESLNLKVDHRADIYALGGTLYFLLTGTTLFPDVQSRFYKENKYEGNYIEDLLSSCSCGDKFKETIAKCMAMHKEDRPQNINEIQEMLVEKTIPTLDDPPPLPEPPSFFANNWYLMLPMIAALGIALVLFAGGQSASGFVAMLLSIGLGITIGVRSSTDKSPARHTTTQFKLLDIHQGTEHYLDAHQSYKVGRLPSCDIIISEIHKSVSREHLLLTCRESHIAVKELKETQGTYINGIKLTPHNEHPWESGDELILVDTDCTFKWEYTS